MSRDIWQADINGDSEIWLDAEIFRRTDIDSDSEIWLDAEILLQTEINGDLENTDNAMIFWSADISNDLGIRHSQLGKPISKIIRDLSLIP